MTPFEAVYSHVINWTPLFYGVVCYALLVWATIIVVRKSNNDGTAALNRLHFQETKIKNIESLVSQLMAEVSRLDGTFTGRADGVVEILQKHANKIEWLELKASAPPRATIPNKLEIILTGAEGKAMKLIHAASVPKKKLTDSQIKRQLQKDVARKMRELSV